MDKAKAGTLMRIESGEYSDYGVIGFFVVLQTFEPMAEVSAYNSQNPNDTFGIEYFDNYAFLAYLLAKGLLLEIDASVFALTDYGNVAECRFTPTTKE